MAVTQQRYALAIRTVYPLGDRQQTDYSSSFRAKRRQNLFYPSLVDLAHVTHTCPTGLMAYPRTHGMEGINKFKKSSRRPPNLAGPDRKVFKEDLTFLRVIRGLA